MRAGVEFRRADQIPDVLQDQQVQALGVILQQSPGRHVRVDVAEAAVVDLQGADAGPVRHTLRVEAALDVHVHFTDVQAALQAVDERHQGRGLPASRRGHEVQKQRPLCGEPLPDQLRRAVVLGKNGFVDLNYPYLAHFAFHSFTFFTSASASSCTPSPVFAEM